MGLFSRKRIVGSMRLDFLSQSEVAVTDQVPEATQEAPYPLWFAFLYAGKILANFPPPSGRWVYSGELFYKGTICSSTPTSPGGMRITSIVPRSTPFSRLSGVAYTTRAVRCRLVRSATSPSSRSTAVTTGFGIFSSRPLLPRIPPRQLAGLRSRVEGRGVRLDA